MSNLENMLREIRENIDSFLAEKKEEAEEYTPKKGEIVYMRAASGKWVVRKFAEVVRGHYLDDDLNIFYGCKPYDRLHIPWLHYWVEGDIAQEDGPHIVDYGGDRHKIYWRYKRGDKLISPYGLSIKRHASLQEVIRDEPFPQ